MDIPAILSRISSHAQALGIFENVNQHEPKNAPGNGASCAIWFERMTPLQSSGLASVSARLEFTVQVYASFVQEPQDDIDQVILTNGALLFREYCGDFDFGGLARMVDIFGAHGAPLDARAGYLKQDNKVFRVMVITLPVIINDVWDEVKQDA